MTKFIFSVICLCLENTKKNFDFFIIHYVYIIDYAIYVLFFYYFVYFEGYETSSVNLTLIGNLFGGSIKIK